VKTVLHILAAGVVIAATPFSADALITGDATEDVIILGEFHDNATHHRRQAAAIKEIKPKAVVFEMLTPDEAAQLADVDRSEAAMQAATDGFHWTNIADYAGVLAASPVILGTALSREEMRGAFSNGAAHVFGDEAKAYGLTKALPDAELETRKQMQFQAHCEAMPLEMMGGMVEAQRLRDATFARTVIEALDTYGAPVMLITGNGHARLDWGVPVYLENARPGISVTSIAQGENGAAPDGVYTTAHTDADPPERGDPCEAFR
jgi:uncharacterized iron-regulated protein